MRPNERDGQDYFFVTPERFEAMVQGGQFFEHATVFDHRYGTPAAPVVQKLNVGGDVLFDIDWQGTQQLAERARQDLVSVFVLPPTHDELERRLKARAQDSDAVVAARMAKAASEISHWPEYDYVIVNRDVDKALGQIKSILEAERARRTRLLGAVAGREDQDPGRLTGAVRQVDGAADHLVGLAGVDPEPEGYLDGGVELGHRGRLSQGHGLGRAVEPVLVDLFGGAAVRLTALHSFSCSAEEAVVLGPRPALPRLHLLV